MLLISCVKVGVSPCNLAARTVNRARERSKPFAFSWRHEWLT